MRNNFYVICIIPFLVTFHTVKSSTILVPSEYNDIKTATIAAAEDDTIMVAPGSYTGSGNHNINFNGKNLVLKSEAGSELTIIDLSGSQGFIFQSGEDHRSVIDGFKIINGQADELGGAVYCKNSSPILRNCIFSNNYSGLRGGAVYCFENSSPRIENCLFEYNSSNAYGGALYFHFGSESEVINCQFINNQSIHGGAIVCDKSSPKFDYCLIAENSASQLGGGVFIQDDCQSEFTNCTIANNSGMMGSAMYIEERFTNLPVSIKIHNSIIAYNRRSLPFEIIKAQTEFSCTNIFGNIAGDWEPPIDIFKSVNNNMEIDPEFVDWENNNYYLLPSSPCAPDNNACQSLIGAFDVLTEIRIISFDIKPGSCDNPINIKSDHNKGVIPVAIYGAEDFDIASIDLESINILGVSPLRWSQDDIGTSSGDYGNPCRCNSAEKDGFEDLTLKFSRSELIDNQIITSASDGNIITITGVLKDGQQFMGQDCYSIRPKGDLDSNGVVDIADLIGFVNFAFHDGQAPEPLETADMNGDGTVDIEDLMDIVDTLFLNE